MTVGDVGPNVIDSLLLLLGTNAGFPLRGGVCHATGDFFVAAYHDPLIAANLFVESFECDDAGAIPATSQSLITETDCTSNSWPKPIKVTDGVIAVIYFASAVGPVVRTYTVDGSGDLTGPVDSLILSGAGGSSPNSPGIWATEHPGLFVGGYYAQTTGFLTIGTFTIDGSGTISTQLDSETIGGATAPNTVGRTGFTWSGRGDFYVVAFSEAVTGDGFAVTHDIDAVGNIAAQQDILEYNTVAAGSPSISSDDAGRVISMFAQSGNVRLETFDVDASGNMTDGPGELISFAIIFPGIELIRIDEDSKTNYVGVGVDNVRTWNVDGAGNVSQLDLLQFVAEAQKNAHCVLHPGNTEIMVCVGFETVFSTRNYNAWSIAVESVAAPAAPAGGSSANPGMLQREILLL